MVRTSNVSIRLRPRQDNLQQGGGGASQVQEFVMRPREGQAHAPPCRHPGVDVREGLVVADAQVSQAMPCRPGR